MTDDRCPTCGGDPDAVVDLVSYGRVAPIRWLPVFTCCVPDPTPAQLRRQAEDDWLDRQRRLAVEG